MGAGHCRVTCGQGQPRRPCRFQRCCVECIVARSADLPGAAHLVLQDGVAYLDPAEWGDHESLDPEKRKHKSPLSAAVVAAFDEATVGWNNALYAALLIAPPSVAAKIPELDREVDRLMDLAVGRTWTKTEFRQQRVDLGRLAADYLRLARSLAGLPDIELPSIWTWDSSNGTAPGHQDAESGSF